MDNIANIAYYEFAIDVAQENRKISECLFGAKATRLISESAEYMEAINEGVASSVIEFIKNLFQKVIDFFKKLFGAISGKNDSGLPKYAVNHNLIKKCEDKIKDIKPEDKNAFKLEKANATAIVDKTLPLVKQIYDKYDKDLNKVMASFESQIEGKSKYELYWLNDAEIEKDKEELKRLSDKDYLADGLTDVSFGDISNIINQYKSSENFMKELRNKLDTAIKKMQEHQKTVEKSKTRLKGEDAKSEEIFNKVRAYILATTAIMTTAATNEFNLNIKKFNSYESILKKFAAFKSEKEEGKEGGK